MFTGNFAEDLNSSDRNCPRVLICERNGLFTWKEQIQKVVGRGGCGHISPIFGKGRLQSIVWV